MTDFEFSYVANLDKESCLRIKKFIERHEWLGKMPTRPTHRFVATYKGKVAGVVIMATPNSFSNLLGPENRHFEKLISRGACISWSPKNLASSLIMFGIRWMAKNTEFRFFTAYSDTEAKELGTIYQACNFTYLGQNSGARCEYFDPDNAEKGIFSDRQFRKTSQIKKYAKLLDIPWEHSWSGRDKVYWDKVPTEIIQRIKDYAKNHRLKCIKKKLHPKHKYIYILGANSKETKQLKQIFEKINPELVSLPYPKIRGPQEIVHKSTANTAANICTPKENILTELPNNGRPQGQRVDTKNSQNQFLTIKEAAIIMRVSEWTVYSIIKSDSTFPFLNIGSKKKFVIDHSRLKDWLDDRASERSFND